MATVLDVAKYILTLTGPITAMKLQKLAYYAQAWNLVWEEEPLFDDKIEAWVNGAVIPALYYTHKGRFKVDESSYLHGDISKLSKSQKENIAKVVDTYSRYTAQQLSDINHQEKPWLEARGDIPISASCQNEITKEAIFEYHSGIWHAS